MVQNGDFTMKDVFVPDNNKLEKATNYSTGAGKILMNSRIGIAWMCVGVAVGAYEAAVKYCMTRKQFGKPIA